MLPFSFLLTKKYVVFNLSLLYIISAVQKTDGPVAQSVRARC